MKLEEINFKKLWALLAFVSVSLIVLLAIVKVVVDYFK